MSETFTAPAALPAIDAATARALPELELVDLILPDMNGLLRGKRVSADSLDKVYRDGVCLPMSLIGSDITGNTVEETGLGYDIGDEDRVCRPVPGSLKPVPWSPLPMAQLLLQMEDARDGLFAAQPREVLKRVLQRYAEKGLTPVIAIELEFYLLDPRLDPSGRPLSAPNPHTGTHDTGTQVYSLQDLDDHRGFTDAVARACKAQGIPANTAVAEYAPGQFEINLAHRDDALLACDDAILLKHAVKSIAQARGLQASFMAKPFVDQAGSGLHVHASVLDAKGDNIFASMQDAPADALKHAIGGLQRSLDECRLMFAPHANSYRRYVPNAFVPLGDSWGFNNRTVAMRIPHGDAKNRRIEHRIAGADANPYLAAAAVLAGMLHGIEQRIDPGAPVVGNAYAKAEHKPPYWRQSIERFLRSEFVAAQFGESFRHVFGQQKLKEMRTFETLVSDIEYAWYLRSV